MIHGRAEEAASITTDIERLAKPHKDASEPVMLCLRRSVHATLPVVAATLIRHYPQRTILCTVLMASQAFLYNAVFFTYGLILTHFYGIEAAEVGWYILPFAAGNFLGPLLLGPLFDSWGRK